MITLIVASVTALIIAAVAISYFRNKPSVKDSVLDGVRERAEQRRLDRAFKNTAPIEDPYNRPYNLAPDMSGLEVDESANGYGQLSEEQKRVIAAIFDNQAQVPSVFGEKNGVVSGSRWSHNVFGEHNQLKPLTDKDVWSNSRR